MNKIINPCTCEVYGSAGKIQRANAYAKIEFVEKRLSICGVVGPMNNGDCLGSAGQCTDEIRTGKPVGGWSREMLDKFCDIWDRWHLNDMSPCCEHQRKLGWLDKAKEPITLYHYNLKREAADEQKKAEKEALKHLKAGETFTPTKDQTFYAKLPYFLDRYSQIDGELAEYYEPHKTLSHGDKEVKFRGHVWYGRSEESTLTKIYSEDGLLCKPCPVCGYKYGTAWQLEEVPQEVIDWLFALPDTERRPAWV